MRTRRMLAVALPLLVGSLLSASCSSDEPSAASEPTPTPTPTSGTSGDAAFPVTVPHKFGETTVTEEPLRVVSVGVTEQDILLQLGVVPVAVTEWYGEKPFATWPWAEDLLGDAEPEVLSTSDGFELERIAALQPDLIIGTNAGLTQKDYDLLRRSRRRSRASRARPATSPRGRTRPSRLPGHSVVRATDGRWSTRSSRSTPLSRPHTPSGRA